MKQKTNVLTEKDKERMIELYNQGKMDTEIAKELNVSDSCIYYWRKRLGLKTKFNYSKISKIDNKKFEELFYAGKNDREIAKELGMAQISVYGHRMRHGYFRQNYAESVSRPLSQEQKEVFLGTLMGDLSLSRQGKHATAKCSHCLKQKEYCEQKSAIFESIGSKCKYHVRTTPDKRNGKLYENYTFEIPANPELDIWYESSYSIDGRKIPFELFEYFTAQSLAYYFMDDGSKMQCGYLLSSMRYSKKDIEKFREFLFDKFGLETSILKNGSIYIKANSARKFEELVSPYMHETMKYKLIHVS